MEKCSSPHGAGPRGTGRRGSHMNNCSKLTLTQVNGSLPGKAVRAALPLMSDSLRPICAHPSTAPQRNTCIREPFLPSFPRAASFCSNAWLGLSRHQPGQEEPPRYGKEGEHGLGARTSFLSVLSLYPGCLAMARRTHTHTCFSQPGRLPGDG